MVKLALLLLILAVIAGVIWQFREGSGRRPRRRQRDPAALDFLPTPVGQLESLRLNKAYWGIEIRSGTCQASKELTGRKFPFAEAPALPLADCAANRCTCSYVGLWERRKWHRRAQGDRRQLIRYLQNHAERRSPKQRRKADIWSKRSL